MTTLILNGLLIAGKGCPVFSAARMNIMRTVGSPHWNILRFHRHAAVAHAANCAVSVQIVKETGQVLAVPL